MQWPPAEVIAQESVGIGIQDLGKVSAIRGFGNVLFLLLCLPIFHIEDVSGLRGTTGTESGDEPNAAAAAKVQKWRNGPHLLKIEMELYFLIDLLPFFFRRM